MQIVSKIAAKSDMGGKKVKDGVGGAKQFHRVPY